MFCDLDRVKAETSGADDKDRLVGCEFGARDERVIGGKDGVCRDGGNRGLHGFLVGRNLDKVPGGDGNVGGEETITTKAKIGVAEAGIVETVHASTTRFGVTSVGAKQSDVGTGLEVGDIRADRDNDAGALMAKNEGVWHGKHSFLEVSVQNAAVGVADTGGEDLDETLVGAGSGNGNHLAGDRCATSSLRDETESDHCRLSLRRHLGYLTRWEGPKVRIHNSTHKD